eukprot:Opistho-2@2880
MGIRGTMSGLVLAICMAAFMSETSASGVFQVVFRSFSTYNGYKCSSLGFSCDVYVKICPFMDASNNCMGSVCVSDVLQDSSNSFTKTYSCLYAIGAGKWPNYAKFSIEAWDSIAIWTDSKIDSIVHTSSTFGASNGMASFDNIAGSSSHAKMSFSYYPMYSALI